MSSIDAAIYNEVRLARKFSEATGSRRQLILRKVVTSSDVLTLPAGYYDIIAIGTGGSGGRAYGANYRATGGGGPAWARDWGLFDSPTPVTITIGARALGAPAGTVNTNGNAGGTTSVTGIPNPIALTGAQGGNADVAGTTPSGGAGGVASGGRIRANGGRGGNVTTTSGGTKSTGGGAVDLFLLGPDRTRGGDLTSTGAGNQNTGGAGVGGRGGDITGTSTTPSTAGGGAGGDASDNSGTATDCGPTLTGVRGSGIAPTDIEVVDVLLAYPGLYPVGSGAFSNSAPVSGGGGGGTTTTTSAVFGGSGGGTTSSGDSLRGGGSGGAAVTTGTPSTGHGGAAVCIVSVYAEVA